MAVYTFEPNTTVKLLSGVPLDRSYDHTRDFSTKADQELYFNSFLLQSFDNFTYQRANRIIRVNIPYEHALKANYCMYLNANYGNKWFYAFVTDVHYISPDVTGVEIETDVMQTWLFDYTIQNAMIEREHTKSDWFFEHIVPENLEFGPNKCGFEYEKSFNDMSIVVAYMPGNIDKGQQGQLFSGVYSGVRYRVFAATTSGVSELNTWLESFASGGYLDDIVSIFMVPTTIAHNWAQNAYLSATPQMVDGYVPRNNKLFTFPYRYLEVSNYAGNAQIYKFELFDNPTSIWFNMAHNFNLESSIWCYPMNYAGSVNGWNDGIGLSDFPICTWTGNIYANWLARNKNQLNATIASQGVGIVSGAAQAALTGNVGALVSPIMSAAHTFSQFADKSVYPYQLEGQQGNSTVNVAWDKVGFLFKFMVIKKEFAKIIDSYFDRFGYKVNAQRIPDTKTRESWNYIKTTEININGPLPQQHLQTIINNYNRGITFWHNSNVGDYTQDNGCVDPGPAPTWPEPTYPPAPKDWEEQPGYVSGWYWPMVGWSNMTITSYFGWRVHPITGEVKYHNGVDIAATAGTPVLALANGVVKEKGMRPNDRGLYISIWNGAEGSQYFYLYQHLQPNHPEYDNLNVGDSVTQGQVVGYTGLSGAVTGPHFHGEIIEHNKVTVPGQVGKDTPIDPLQFYVPNYGSQSTQEGDEA